MSFLAIPDFEVIQQGFADIGKKRAKNTFLLYKRKVSLAFAKLTFFAEREGESGCERLIMADSICSDYQAITCTLLFYILNCYFM